MSTETTPSRPFRRWCGRFAFLFLLIVIAVIVWFRMTADIDWPATLILFGPRWLLATPLILIGPIVLLVRTKLGIASSLLAGLLIAGPFMGGAISIPGDSTVSPDVLRFATFNADYKSFDRTQLHAWLQREKPDVLALQDAGRITVADLPPGYQLHPAANGLQLATTHTCALMDELHHESFGPSRGAARFRVAFPTGAKEIVNVHLPTPRSGLEAVLARDADAPAMLEKIIHQRNAASAALREWIGNCEIILGDFNMPAESTIYRRDWLTFQNAFNERGLGWGWTMFSKRGAVRIDHIIFKRPWTCRFVEVGPDLGSAHRPVIADLAP